jgi:hypothetical protein
MVRKGLLGEIREVHTWTTMRLLDSKSKIPELAKQEKIPDGSTGSAGWARPSSITIRRS